MLGLGVSLSSGGAISSGVVPTDISDLAFWFKNNTGVAAAQWDDSSGNDNHMAQSVSGDQASVSGGGLLFVDGENDHYDLTTAVDIGASNAFTMIIVLNITDHDTKNVIFGNKASGAAATFLEMQTEDQIRFRQTATIAVLKFEDSGNFPAGAKYMITVTKDTSRNLVVYKNGSVLTQDSSTGTPVASGAFSLDQIGGKATNPDDDFDGYMYELLLYEKLLSAEELSGVHSEIQARNGL